VIKTENLTKDFDGFRAVDRINLEVESGEVLALLGPNGAGKTTTVRMLTTVLKPSGGSARVAGFDVRDQPQQVRESVGVLTEDHGLYDRMHLEDYLDFFGQLYGMEARQRRKRIQKLYTDFGLEHDLDRRIGEFSKGMRQKLSLARTLLHSPSVLLLDEPTSAMDPESARMVHQAILNLRSEKRAIIICTHNLSEAEVLADKIAIIRRGRLIAQGSPAALRGQLLGPAEFRVQIRDPLDDLPHNLLNSLDITGQGRNWFQFRTTDPEELNPRVIQALTEAGLRIIRVEEIEQKLESVYLEAVRPREGER
jgi:ABC-2 type transport system ATP-binding protein